MNIFDIEDRTPPIAGMAIRKAKRAASALSSFRNIPATIVLPDAKCGHIASACAMPTSRLLNQPTSSDRCVLYTWSTREKSPSLASTTDNNDRTEERFNKILHRKTDDHRWYRCNKKIS
jgi:hypothetical protein